MSNIFTHIDETIDRMRVVSDRRYFHWVFPRGSGITSYFSRKIGLSDNGNYNILIVGRSMFAKDLRARYRDKAKYIISLEDLEKIRGLSIDRVFIDSIFDEKCIEKIRDYVSHALAVSDGYILHLDSTEG